MRARREAEEKIKREKDEAGSVQMYTQYLVPCIVRKQLEEEERQRREEAERIKREEEEQQRSVAA